MCTVEAEKIYIRKNMQSSFFRYNFTIYLSAKCWVLLRVERPLLHISHSLLSCTNSTQYLHQFNTITNVHRAVFAFAHHRSFSLPQERHLQPTLIAVCDTRFRNAPLQTSPAHTERASWLHFTEQQSFSPSPPSSPLLSSLSSSPLLSPLLSSPLPPLLSSLFLFC